MLNINLLGLAYPTSKRRKNKLYIINKTVALSKGSAMLNPLDEQLTSNEEKNYDIKGACVPKEIEKMIGNNVVVNFERLYNLWVASVNVSVMVPFRKQLKLPCSKHEICYNKNEIIMNIDGRLQGGGRHIFDVLVMTSFFD